MDAKAQTFLGKIMLVNIRHFDEHGDDLKSEMFHGEIIEIREDAVVLMLRGEKTGETYTLPQILDDLDEPEFPVYKNEETGEIIENPDFIVSFNAGPSVESLQFSDTPDTSH